MHSEVLFLGGLGLVLVPQFRWLVLVIPFKILIPRAKDPFLCPDAVLVPSYPKIQSLKAVFGDVIFQGDGLKLVAALEFSLIRADAFS